MAKITFPSDWWRRHNSSDLLYELRLRFVSGAECAAVWKVLEKEHTVGETGSVLIGGAAIQHLGVSEGGNAAEVLIISGGEDALDSLGYAIEDLEEAVSKAGAAMPEVVDHVRSLERG
ncbi:Uncharacterised protein [Dermatophilus congolensis]|uniref:Uncharacterized protein n=1 Tax=Dermatophilus congolensis TaxID=1863 RepID=A0AA46BNH8_9MICO|nr:XRE family transcriptional regulator [Dermatophilus congolensis]STD10378.1 Uncharacterised protein [Dermatophilus congolensis]